MSDFHSCIIMGAGISGLLAAQRLRDYHIDVTIIEKSRSCGGRMAVKTVDNAIYDIGAQFMTTRDSLFRERVEKWLSKEEVKPWYKGPLGNMRYVGCQGMATVTNRIGSELNVKLSETITRLERKKDKWIVRTRPHGETKQKIYKSDWLILTAPVPQSLKLLIDSDIQIDYDAEDELKKIDYLRCITVYAQLNGPAGLPNPGAMDLNHDCLRWIGDNFAKKVSPSEGSITIHSSPQFAKAYWDSSDEEKTAAILAAAKPFIKADVVSSNVHRWRYSDPIRIYNEKHPFRKPYFIDENLNLGMCGDAFNGPRIEAAALSGMSLATAMVNPT